MRVSTTSPLKESRYAKMETGNSIHKQNPPIPPGCALALKRRAQGSGLSLCRFRFQVPKSGSSFNSDAIRIDRMCCTKHSDCAGLMLNPLRFRTTPTSQQLPICVPWASARLKLLKGRRMAIAARSHCGLLPIGVSPHRLCRNSRRQWPKRIRAGGRTIGSPKTGLRCHELFGGISK